MVDWKDWLIGLILAVAIGLSSYQGAKLIPPLILNSEDVWFQADVRRVFDNVTSRWSNHSRTSVHPLFLLLAFGPIYVLKHTLPIEPVVAVRIFSSAVASLWLGTLFMLLRLIGCRRQDAVLFSLLVASSASALFWLVVPDSYALGSLTILISLCLVAFAEFRTIVPSWYVVISALTLSVTITNWMAGILATLASHPWKRALQLTTNAFCLVVVLWGAQKILFPSAKLFLGNFEDTAMIFSEDAGGFLHIVQSFFFHTMAMPDIKTQEADGAYFIIGDKIIRPGTILSTQYSAPGSGSIWGMFALILWVGLLALGCWGMIAIAQHRRFRMLLGLTLLGQLVLPLLYGDETFLFSLHFAPLLVLLAALSTLTRARVGAIVLASGLLLCAGINNG